MRNNPQNYSRRVLGVDHLPFPMVVIDEKLRIIAQSAVTNSFFGFNKGLPEFFFDLPIGTGDLWQAFNEQKAFEEVVAFNANNTLRRIRMQVHPKQQQGQELLHYIYFEDFTLQKLDYELGQKVQRIARIGSWSVDLLKNTIYWSNVTKQIHEVPLNFEPNLETGIEFYKEGDHRERIVAAVAECIQNGKSFDEELLLITALGNEKWVRAIGEAEIINGRTVGFFGVFQDIDSSKRQEVELQTLYNRLEVATSSAKIGVWENDIIKKEYIWSPKMYELFGVSSNIQKNAMEVWESLIHPNDHEKTLADIEEALAGKKPLNIEYRITKPDGQLAYHNAFGKVFRNEAGEPIKLIGVTIDVSHVKQKDARLIKLLEMTEKQNKKFVEFARIISHNVRSSSSNISMLSGMLLANIGQEQHDEFLQMIQQSSDNLESTLNDLNEIIRIQSIEENDLQEVRVQKVVQRVIQKFGPDIQEYGATVVNNITDDKMVLGNINFINDILTNLISNALKYRAKQRKLNISIYTEEDDQSLTVCVADNGQGIDMEAHGKQLFELYKTFHKSKNAKGVGLFINKNQMEVMNGQIEVLTQKGVGSTFKLIFPKS